MLTLMIAILLLVLMMMSLTINDDHRRAGDAVDNQRLADALQVDPRHRAADAKAR
jgi:hypothetical protein